MPQNRSLFARAGSEATRNDLRGAAWPVYEHFEVERDEVWDGGEKLYEDVLVYAPFRPPPLEPGQVYTNDSMPRDEGLRQLYAPLRDVPDLFLRFASLARKRPLSRDGALRVMLEWITTYGVLGLEGLYCPRVPEEVAGVRERRESLRGFIGAVREAGWCLDLYEAATVPDDDLAEAALNRHRASGNTLGEKREWALIVAGDTVGDHVSADCHPRLYRRVEKDVGEGFGWTTNKTIAFDWGWGFRSLLGAMYLQMMLYMAEGGEGRLCKRPDCYRLVTFDPPRPADDPGLKKSARGKYRTRVDKEFCTKACAQWWSDNYGDSKKARRKRERQRRKS